MATRCARCSVVLAAGAKFCPRCGLPAVADPPLDIGKRPAPLPLGGVLFLVTLVLAVAALVTGGAFGIHGVVYAGVALVVALAVLLALGAFL